MSSRTSSRIPPTPRPVRWCAARRGDEAPKALPVAGNLQACAVCLGRSVGTDNPPTVFWLAGGAVARRWVCWRLRPALACRWWPPVPSPCLPAKEASAGQLARTSLVSASQAGLVGLRRVFWMFRFFSHDCLPEEPGTIGRAAAGLGTPSCCQVRLKASRHLPALLRCQAFSRQGPADPGLAIAAPRRCAAWRELGAPANQRQPPRCCGGGGKRIMESAAEFWAIESRRNSCERRAQPRGGGGEGQPAKTF